MGMRLFRASQDDAAQARIQAEPAGAGGSETPFAPERYRARIVQGLSTLTAEAAG
jgi:hypothetical protein